MERRGGGRSEAHGSDLRYNMTISLEEAFAGKQATIRVPGTAACEPFHLIGRPKLNQP